MDRQAEIKRRLMLSIEKMPSLPTTVTKVIELANDVNSSAREMLKVIQMDPVLTAKVLKLINSAFFGMPNKISLKQALVMLGINTIKNLALSTAIIGQMGSSKIKVTNFDQYRFWEHSLGAGIAAKKICLRIESDPRIGDEYFVAGLVHDIGKVVMALALPKFFANTIVKAQADELSSVKAETDEMGLDHTEVGGILAEKWKLGENLIASTSYHHDPQEGQHRLVWAIHVANYFLAKKGYPNSNDFAEPWVHENAFDHLGISEDVVEEDLSSLSDEIQKATVFLQS
ncbi:MAG: HDOD domain-containing protein [Gemmatimonadota bacterium]|nr:HDOD domain-containing protein [Gemmatimonadota bacterium]